MKKPEYSGQFKRDVKQVEKRGKTRMGKDSTASAQAGSSGQSDTGTGDG
jgi:hypothetical protein